MGESKHTTPSTFSQPPPAALAILLRRGASMNDAAETWREWMRRYTTLELHGLSDLYEAIGQGITGDDELLHWLGDVANPRSNPNLLFAAVHFRLLTGAFAPDLAPYFASITPGALPPAGPPPVYPAFRAFWERERDALAAILATRTTQTNEVGRCMYLLPAFVRVAARMGRPLAVVDAGTAAGLTLLIDRFACDYGEGRIAGDPRSPVHLRTEVRGVMPPIAPAPTIVSRTGIDLAPIDVQDDDATTWLRACVWPEHAARRETLEAAIAIARRDPPRLVAGNVVDVLPAIAAQAPPEATLVVVNTNVLPYFSAAERARYAAVLEAIGASRDLAWVAVEWPAYALEAGFRGSFEGIEMPSPALPLTLTTFERGTRRDEVLAVTGPHGRWLRWLLPPGA